MLSNIKLRKVQPNPNSSTDAAKTSNTPSWTKNRRPTYVLGNATSATIDTTEKERKAREAADRAESERKAKEAADRAESERKAKEAADRAESERKVEDELYNNATGLEVLPQPLVANTQIDNPRLADIPMIPDGATNVNDARLQNQADLVADVLQLRNAVRKSFKIIEPISAAQVGGDETAPSIEPDTAMEPSNVDLPPVMGINRVNSVKRKQALNVTQASSLLLQIRGDETAPSIEPDTAMEPSDVDLPPVMGINRVNSVKRKQALNVTQASSLLSNVNIESFDVSNDNYFDDQVGDHNDVNKMPQISSQLTQFKSPQIRSNRNLVMETVPEADEDDEDSSVPHFLGPVDKIRSFREALEQDREAFEDRPSIVTTDLEPFPVSRLSDTNYTMSMDEELELKQRTFKAEVRPTFVNNFRFFEQKVNEVGGSAPMPSVPARSDRRRSRS